jgi:hypothetical protein
VAEKAPIPSSLLLGRATQTAKLFERAVSSRFPAAHSLRKIVGKIVEGKTVED